MAIDLTNENDLKNFIETQIELTLKNSLGNKKTSDYIAIPSGIVNDSWLLDLANAGALNYKATALQLKDYMLENLIINGNTLSGSFLTLSASNVAGDLDINAGTSSGDVNITAGATGRIQLGTGVIIDSNGHLVEYSSGGVTIEGINIENGDIEQIKAATNLRLLNSLGSIEINTPTGGGVFINGGATGTQISGGTFALATGTQVNNITTTVDVSSTALQVATADAIYAAIIASGSTPVVLNITSYDQRTFTLPSTPPVPGSTHAFVNGKRLKYGTSPGGEYTISGTTLTYNARDYPLETDMEFIYLKSLQLSGVKSKTFYAEIKDVNVNLGNGRYRQIGSTGAYRLSFTIPGDFVSWGTNGCKLQGVVASGAAQSGRDIDIAGEYGNMGEPYNNNTFSDTTLSIDLTGAANQNTNIIDLLPYLGGVTAGDHVNIFVDHNGIGTGGIYYTRFALDYNYSF